MNMLNNAILEGNIKSYTKNDGFVDFVVASSRYSLDGNKRIETVTEVICRAFGTIQNSFERVAKVGRGVRVVGRLAGSNGSIVLECEHIEWKLSQIKM